MKKISILLTGFILMTAIAAYAQDGSSSSSMSSSSSSSSAISKNGLSLSVGPEFILPVGTFRSEGGYKFGIGGSVKLAIPLAANFDGTISAGYIGFSQSKINGVTDKNTFTTIPFKGGIRYRTNMGLYVEPQAGYTQTKFTNEETSGQFTYALNIGYLINKMIDISARYEAISSKDQTVSGVTVPGESVKMIGLRIAYSFNFARSK